MTGAGFFFLHRSIWFSDSDSLRDRGAPEARRLEAWIWLLSQANWSDAGTLRAGQFTTSRGKIAAYTGWSDGKVRAWLKCLCKEGAISLERNGNHSILTVENWAEYQSGYRLDLGPSQDRARTEPGPTQDQPAASGDAGSREITTNLGPTQDQPRSDLGPATTEEGITNNQEDPPKPPKGADAGASGVDAEEDEEEPVRDSTGEVWPKPKPGRMNYPQGFEKIWEVWKRAQKAAPKAVKAAGKGNAYELCRGHLSRGSTPEEMRGAAIKYLLPFTNKTETVGCFQPSRFYRASGAEFFEYLDDPAELGPAPIRERWHNPRDAWRECASLSTHLGLELPDVPKRTYGAEWEDVEKFHPLIVEFATDRSGFKEVPDDLAARIQGGNQ